MSYLKTRFGFHLSLVPFEVQASVCLTPSTRETTMNSFYIKQIHVWQVDDISKQANPAMILAFAKLKMVIQHRCKWSKNLMSIVQVADRGDRRPSDWFPRRKPTSSSNPIYSRGNCLLQGPRKKRKTEKGARDGREGKKGRKDETWRKSRRKWKELYCSVSSPAWPNYQILHLSLRQ